jgi:hypothetical protein
VIVSDTTDEKMIEIKKKISKAVEGYEKVEIELSTMG